MTKKRRLVTDRLLVITDRCGVVRSKMNVGILLIKKRRNEDQKKKTGQGRGSFDSSHGIAHLRGTRKRERAPPLTTGCEIAIECVGFPSSQ